MIQNNLDPDVAENPDRAGRLRRHRQRGAQLGMLRRDPRDAEDAGRRRDAARPVGQAGRRLHDARRRAARADRQLATSCRRGRRGTTSASSTRKGLMMYGQMTAGSWIYIGSQGIVQGTYETFAEARDAASTAARAGRLDRSPPGSAAWAARSRSPPRWRARRCSRSRWTAVAHRQAAAHRATSTSRRRRPRRGDRAMLRYSEQRSRVSIGLARQCRRVFPETRDARHPSPTSSPTRLPRTTS